MDTRNKNEEMINEHYKKQNSGKKMFGLLLVSIGAIWAMKEGGVPLPDWIFSWGLLLIAVGLVNGFKNNFKLGGWLIPLLIGGVFFADEFYPMDNIHAFLWPLVLVAFGLIMIFKPKHSAQNCSKSAFTSKGETDIEFLEMTTVMGGAEKNVMSQNFKGGNVTSFLGGSEINFLKADLHGTAILDVTCVMGGSKLTVPANWLVKSEVTAIMGGVEDKRLINDAADLDKVLIIKGTTVMGAIEIVSH
jgi:predicted membrane protein